MKISKSYLKKFISIGLVTLVSVLLIVSCTSKQNNKIDINNISYPNTIAENAKISDEYKDVAQKLSDDAIYEFINNISKIPRGSGHMEKISQYLFNWAKENGFNPIVDNALNVYFDVPATQGMENYPKVILQSHMDMVNVSKDPNINMETDAINLNFNKDDKSIQSSNNMTTIGADDAEGIITSLTIAKSKDIKHGPLRILITTDEEIGLRGAQALDPKAIDANYALNVDGCYIGRIDCSAAGLFSGKAIKTYNTTTNTNKKILDIDISGLVGGHSGGDITKPRASAIDICHQILTQLFAYEIEVNIVSINGGDVTNAICNKCEMKIALNDNDINNAKDIIQQVFDDNKNKYTDDKDASYSVNVSENNNANLINNNDSKEILGILNLTHYGVQKMSNKYEGLPQTSTNPPIIKINDGKAEINTSMRSSDNEIIKNFKANFENSANKAGYQVEILAINDAWPEPQDDSFINLMLKAYTDACNFEGVAYATHTSLECAEFYKYNPNVKILSIGADVKDEHGTTETLYTKSFPAHFASILYLLEHINTLK